MAGTSVADRGEVSAEFDRMFADLAGIGRDPAGGYRRFAWTSTDAVLREWFAAEAQRRGLDVVVDRVGNQWAWWGDPDADGPGVVTGSHLDSVPGGGAFDGPLGVVSGFLAVDALRAAGWRPARPLAVVNTVDEEGARFGLACAGSRLLTGRVEPVRALALTDDDGVSMAEAMRRAGQDPAHVGADPDALRRAAVFLELHIEQGRALIDLGRPVGVASMIWPHGRWRISLAGRANHAGTTPLPDRRDPMLGLAALVTQVRAAAARHGALATVGKVRVEPNGVNAIPSQVTAWLDCRAPERAQIDAVLRDLAGFEAVQESWTPVTRFDPALAQHLAAQLGSVGGRHDHLGPRVADDASPEAGTPMPLLGTGAGHDAGVLSAHGVPSAMLFVRNPTGVSHAPDEHAERDDCLAGVAALARSLAELTTSDRKGRHAEHHEGPRTGDL